MPVAPDIVVLASDLKPFVVVVGSTLFVSPGRLAKARAGALSSVVRCGVA